MANKHLETYLNDHLAGAVTALELIDSLAAAYAGKAVGHFFANLHAEVAADRQELETLMDRLHVTESRPRKVAGWIGEQVTQLKLRLDDPTGGPLRLLESLDFLVAGIEGKRALWLALDAAAAEVPELQGMDYERLVHRAEEQRSRMEVVRREAAKVAFSSAS